jgi:hypothetical protein
MRHSQSVDEAMPAQEREASQRESKTHVVESVSDSRQTDGSNMWRTADVQLT